MVVQPGLYEVIFGFYTNHKPSVQMYVNGDIVISMNQSHNSTIQKNVGSFTKHDKKIAGLTHVEFIALPSKCRVSFS